jgi:NADH-quinone oxidoreductase subunit G
MAGIPGVAFISGLRRANVNGALDAGLAAGVLPGRVSLEEGREWYEYHWKAPLPPKGVGTSAILSDASRGRIGALVLVGADPLSDFPDSYLALRGLLGARFVVAIDTNLTKSVRRADVVLPAAAWGERRGTFTNIEGRITRLSQLVTDPGVAWPDWMIASELAARLGVDLGFSALEDIWDELTRVSPLHQGATYDVMAAHSARDGIVVPVDGNIQAAAARPRPLDPMADPGIASAELHKVAPTALLMTTVEMVPESDGYDPDASDQAAEEGDGRVAPPLPPTMGLPAIPAPDGSSPPATGLRLVARRTMWDAGTQVQALPMLANLHPDPVVSVHPSVLAGVGAADGEQVKVASSRGSIVLPAKADPAVPRGVALMAWNLPGPCPSDLIDSSKAVTEVTIHSLESERGEPGG